MKTKYCSKCELGIAIKFFSKNITTKDGLQCWCKKCVIEDSRTINGLVRKIYSKQRESCRHRKHYMPNYSKDELLTWVSTQPLFFVLYEQWVKSGFQKDLIPSIDRKDDYKSYTFENIQIMTWIENRTKGYSSEKSIAARELFSINPKKTYQFSLDCILINSFDSTFIAGKETGISHKNIGACCRNELLSAGGFLWSYNNVCPIRTNEEILKIKKVGVKKVGQFKNDILVKCFNNSSQASRETNIPKSSISANCRNETKQAGGYVWKFI